MIMISSRENFWSTTEIAEADAIKEVVLLNPETGVDKDLTEAQFLQRVKNKRVLILVHGYNNDEDDVNRAYSMIENTVAAEVTGQYGIVMGYTWPGGNLRISYPAAKARAKAVSSRLAGWLRKAIAKTKSVDVMCHSLGNLVTLRALNDLSKEQSARVRNCYLLAAAVDNESIEKGEDYYPGTQICDKAFVFHTNKDDVLRFAYPAGEAISFHSPDLALGLTGPEDVEDIINHSPNVKVVNCKHVIEGHGKYKESIPMYRYINNELTGQPATQFSTLRPV